MITEIYYIGRDNTIDVQLRADGAPIAMDDVTKVELIMSDTLTIDSATDPDVFDLTGHLAAVSAADRKMIIDLNEKSGDPITAETYRAKLAIYDTTNPSGIIWDYIKIEAM